MDVCLQPTFFSVVKENAFHRPHNSWLTEEVVDHVALAIVAGSRAFRNLFLRLMLRHMAAVPLKRSRSPLRGLEARFGPVSVLSAIRQDQERGRRGSEAVPSGAVSSHFAALGRELALSL